MGTSSQSDFGSRVSPDHSRTRTATPPTIVIQLPSMSFTQPVRTRSISLDLISSSVSGESNDAQMIDVIREDSKTLQWGTIEVLEHGTILGCNPGVSSGPPLTMDWEAKSKTVISIDNYESVRKSQRRPDNHLRLSKFQRWHFLLNSGVDSEDIKAVETWANFIRRSRRESAEDPQDSFELKERKNLWESVRIFRLRLKRK